MCANTKMRLLYRLYLISTATLCVALVGCTNPYENKLPQDGRLTAGEVEIISQSLSGSDQDRFKRWAVRVLRKETYGGEPSASTVKHALLNQTEFEMRERKELIDIAGKRAEQEKISRQKEQEQREKRLAVENITAHRAAVDAEIRKYFSAQALNYEFRPIFNQRGEEYARQWVFKLKLNNNSSRAIVGAVGWANISDVFGNSMGSYPMKIEPQVAPGKSIEYFVTMDHNRKNPQHVAMTEAKTFMVNWFFESVAFSDGSIIDQKSIAKAQDKSPTLAPAKSAPL